jgi:hypothetical protein
MTHAVKFDRLARRRSLDVSRATARICRLPLN